MRRPWHGPLMLAGADANSLELTIPSNLDNPIERKNAEWGGIGLAAGFVLGLIFGSKFTLHAPVRRRRG